MFYGKVGGTGLNIWVILQRGNGKEHTGKLAERYWLKTYRKIYRESGVNSDGIFAKPQEKTATVK